MYYIYKIENIKNHKKYIGLTNNIKRRRSRHFTDLKCNRHENSFLQKEYNIFGKENFIFEILENKWNIIDEIKRLQKIATNNKDEVIELKLKELYSNLNSYPVYQNYIIIKEELNDNLYIIKDIFEKYFKDLLKI